MKRIAYLLLTVAFLLPLGAKAQSVSFGSAVGGVTISLGGDLFNISFTDYGYYDHWGAFHRSAHRHGYGQRHCRICEREYYEWLYSGGCHHGNHKCHKHHGECHKHPGNDRKYHGNGHKNQKHNSDRGHKKGRGSSSLSRPGGK